MSVGCKEGAEWITVSHLSSGVNPRPKVEGHARVDKEVSLPLVTTSTESLPPKELVCQGKGDKVDKGDKGEA